MSAYSALIFLIQLCLVASSPILIRSTSKHETRSFPTWLNAISAVKSVGSNGMPVTLGAACPFSITAQTGISTIAPSAIWGDVGVFPITMAAVTGFSMQSTVSPAGSSQLKGNSNYPGSSVSSAVYGPGTTQNSAIPNSNKAIQSALSAFATLNLIPAGPPVGTSNSQIYMNYLGGVLPTGTILEPGVYRFTTPLVILPGAIITLNGKCSDVFVFISASTISSGAGSSIILGSTIDRVNQLSAASVYWVAQTSIITGVGSVFAGVLLAATNVVIGTGTTLTGMVYTQTQIAVQQATILRPSSCTIKSSNFSFSLECDAVVPNGLQPPLVISNLCPASDPRLLVMGSNCRTTLVNAYEAYMTALAASNAALSVYNKLCTTALASC